MPFQDVETILVELEPRAGLLARLMARLAGLAAQPRVPRRAQPSRRRRTDGGLFSPPGDGGSAAEPAGRMVDESQSPLFGRLRQAPVSLERMRSIGLIDAGQRTRAGEEFKLVASHLRRSGREAVGGARRLPRAIMVSSSQAGEGKSFTSLNLAATLARHGPEGTLLIDLDSKPQSLSELLGLKRAPGLQALAIDGVAAPASLLHPTPLARLAVLPLGQVGADGLQDDIVCALERLAAAYPEHTLVLDMPPCLSTSDASTLAAHVGQVLLVVEAERTQQRELETSLELLAACPQISVILNKTRKETRGQFGGRYYGYYYGRQ